MSESSVGSSSEVNSPVSFTTMEKREEKIEELDELMGNLDIGEAMGHSELDQKDFTTRSGGVSSNIHQVCVIITEVAEENDDACNLVVDTHGNEKSYIKQFGHLSIARRFTTCFWRCAHVRGYGEGSFYPAWMET
jgi:hypothetical protein